MVWLLLEEILNIIHILGMITAINGVVLVLRENLTPWIESKIESIFCTSLTVNVSSGGLKFIAQALGS